MTDEVEVTQADHAALRAYLVDRARLAFDGTTAPHADLLLKTLARHRHSAEQHERERIVAWLRAENGLCDCFARSEGECACGAWDDYKRVPLCDLADAIEQGQYRSAQ